MHLAPEEADQVRRLHRTLMRFVDERLAPLGVAGSAAGCDTSPTERQERLAEALALRFDLIDAFIEANPAGWSGPDLPWDHDPIQHPLRPGDAAQSGRGLSRKPSQGNACRL